MLKPLPRICRLPEVLTFSGLGRTQLHMAVKAGHFPPPVKLTEGGRAVGWYEHELLAWNEERAKRRVVASGIDEGEEAA